MEKHNISSALLTSKKNNPHFFSFGSRPKKIYHLILFLTIIIFNFLPLGEGRWGCLYSQPVTQEWAKKYHDTTGNYNSGCVGIGLDNSGNIYTGGETRAVRNLFIAIKYNSDGIRQWVGKFFPPDSSSGNATALAVDGSGNVYILGDNRINSGPRNIMVVKFNNSTGNVEWWRRYNDLVNVESSPGSICIDKMGNVYVAGGTQGYSLVLKYSPQGDTLWTRKEYFNVSFLYDCAVDDSNNIYACGFNDYIYSQRSHIFSLKYSLNGVLQWNRSYTNETNCGSVCISVDSIGNCYLGGFIRHPSGGGANFAVLKYDRFGNYKWLTQYIMQMYTDAFPNDICVNRQGSMVVAAGMGGFNSYDYFTIGFNAVSGDTLWTQKYDGPGHNYDEIYSIIMDKYNNSYVTGRSVGSGSAGYDFATLRYSPSGHQDWLIRYSDYDDQAISVALDSNLNVYVSGVTWISSSQPSDIVTVKYSQFLGVKSIITTSPKNFKLYQNYPNPFNPTTKIKFDIPPSRGARGVTAKIVIYDLLGREIVVLVNQELTPGTYEVEWDGSNYPSGVYFYRLTVRQAGSSTGDFVQTMKMILIK